MRLRRGPCLLASRAARRRSKPSPGGCAWLVFVVSIVLLAGACSDDGNAVGTPSTSEPSPTTSSAGTTRSSVSTTTTTRNPTSARSAMLAAFSTGTRAYEACVMDPPHCDRTAIDATYAGAARSNVLSYFGQLERDGLRGRFTASTYYTVIERVVVDAALTSGTLTVCGVDGGVIYDPRDPNNPNDDVIVNDRLESGCDTWTMKIISGSWKRAAVKNLVTWTGANRCPPPTAG
jgi:hypothetical protein